MNKKVKKTIINLFYKIIGKPQWRSSEECIKWYKTNGIKIGRGCFVKNPKRIKIDISRPELIEIGNNVFLHEGTIILSHDWASWVFVNKNSDFIPSHGRVKIGNNVWLGQNVTILKNVEIGDNVIIGAGSIVTKSIPSNSIAVGCPARVINTLDEYHNKRNSQYIYEAIDYAIAIYESGRTPMIEDFKDDYPVFVDCRNYSEYDYPYKKIFSPEQFEAWIKNHKAPYFGFKEFMKDVDKERRKRLKNNPLS